MKTKSTKTKNVGIARRIGALLAAVTLVGGVAACGEPVGDIDRTQPNRVAKTVFEGEWWSRAVVVDKQFQTTFPFIGFEDGMDRVRWEITQTRLVAYRSYERTPGSGSGNGVGDSHVIAAFPIMMHFDVTRSYNPVNGVEQNVLIENTFDRPWWERDFIRVNWSRNLVDDWTIAGFVQSLSPMKVTRNANADPANPWKVRFEDSDNDDEIDYFETTIESILQPSFWACYLVGDWYNNCQGADARVKYSFRKIPASQERAYESLDYPDFETITFGTLITTDPLTGNPANVLDGNGNPLPCLATEELEPGQQCDDPEEVWVASTPEGTFFCDATVHDPDDCQPFTIDIFPRFGYFRNDRYLLDRENGFTLTARERLINRWNLWERSLNEDGESIPYADRTTKPIIYHTNVHLPPSMMPAVQAMAQDWNVAFKETVAELQGRELDDVEDMYIVRENDCNVANVEQYISDNAGLHDFKTDLMAHNISGVGYGNLENACAVLEHYSKELNANYDENVLDEDKVPVFTWQQLGDLRYSLVTWLPKAELSGPLGYGPSATDPLTGEIVSANANIYGASLDTYANYGADIVDSINGRITEGDVINGTHIREYIGDVRARYSNKLGEDVTNRFIQMAKDRTDHLTDDQYFVQVPPTAFNQNLDLIAETGFEDEFLMTADTMMLFGGPEAAEASMTGSGIPEHLADMARPSTWSRQQIPAQAMASPGGEYLDVYDNPFNKMSALERFQRRQDFFGRMNACFDAEMVEPAIADLALQLVDLPREEVVLKIRSSIMRAVLAHEVGHTVGLRHNFEGSADSLNYFPQFWGVDLGEDDPRMGASNNPEELQYSTIMDYHQRFNSDFGGIGMYDRAAIRFGYGELIEVFDEGRWDPDFGIHEDSFLPVGWDQNLDLFYGEDLPILLSGDPDTGEKIDDHFEEISDRFFDGDTTAYMDIQTLGITPRAQNLFKRKNMDFNEYKKAELYRLFGNVNTDGEPPALAVDYMYCSDAYAWGGNLTCNRWDKGFTSELIVNNAAQMYEFYYPFSAFRGQRLWEQAGWRSPVGGYMGRLYSRTYQPMLNAFRYFFFFQRSSSTVFPLVRDWAKASFVGANFFGRVLQTPEPGRYCLSDDAEWYVPEAEATSCSDSIDLGIGDSRYYDSAYTQEFQFRPQNVGQMYDKVLALQAMTSSNAFFFRDFSNFLSRGAFSIGYYRLFQPEVLSLYNGFIMGDNEEYAAKVSVVDGKPEIAFDTFLDFQGEFPAAQGTKLKPTDSDVLRYFAMFYAMANLTSQMDSSLDYAQRARITLVGSQNDPTVDPTIVPDQILFTDPQTNFVYKAAAPDGPDLSLGFQLLTDAQDFVDTNYQPAKDTLDVARAALEAEQLAGGDTTDEIAAVEAAEDALAPMGRVLNEKMQIIEQVRQLSDILEYSR